MIPLNNVELLKKGTIALPGGEKLEVDDQLLDELVGTYDPTGNHEAPVVLGHSADNPATLPSNDGAPAQGWLLKLRRNKTSLIGDFEITDNLSGWIRDKLYKKLSISFYPKESDLSPSQGKAYIRHVALLGASPPVVKGLEAYSLSENGAIMTNELELQEGNPLDQKAANWLRLILSDGDKGFKDPIVSFSPEPSADNSYLVDDETGAIAGKFLNEQGIEFSFTIAKSDDGFSREFSPTNAAKAEEQQKEATGQGPAASDLAEELVERTPIDEPENEQLGELEMTEKSRLEEVVTDEEVVAAQEELNAEIEEPIAEEQEAEEPIAEEQEQEADEMTALREENRKLRLMQEKLILGEITNFSEQLYSSGKLVEGVAKQQEVISFLSKLHSSQQAISLSENGETASMFDWAKNLLTNLPVAVELSEIASSNKAMDKALTSLYSPAGTVIDQDQADLHGRVISFCEANNLNSNVQSQYRTALKEVINNGTK